MVVCLFMLAIRQTDNLSRMYSISCPSATEIESTHDAEAEANGWMDEYFHPNSIQTGLD